MASIATKDALSPELAKQIEADIREEYRDFPADEPLPEGSQNWRERRSVQLLYAVKVKIDAAYQKLAERHVRDAVHFYFMCDQVAPYLARQAAEKQAKAAA